MYLALCSLTNKRNWPVFWEKIWIFRIKRFVAFRKAESLAKTVTWTLLILDFFIARILFNTSQIYFWKKNSYSIWQWFCQAFNFQEQSSQISAFRKCQNKPGWFKIFIVCQIELNLSLDWASSSIRVTTVLRVESSISPHQ